MNKSRTPIAPDQIAALCRGRRIRRLSLFGSALRAGFWPGSDVWLRPGVHNEAEVLYAAQG